jgi:hypothetical protein
MREYRRFKDTKRLRNTFRLSLAFTKFYQDVWQKKGNIDYDNEGGRKRKK